jgi:hypothetical protein
MVESSVFIKVASIRAAVIGTRFLMSCADAMAHLPAEPMAAAGHPSPY